MTDSEDMLVAVVLKLEQDCNHLVQVQPHRGLPADLI